MKKYVIIGLIWDGFGDFSFANYIKNLIPNSDVYFIFIMEYKINNNTMNLVESMFNNYKFTSYQKLISILKNYDVIIQTTASYSRDPIFKILFKNYPHKLKNYYRIFDYGLSSEYYYNPSEKVLDCHKSYPRLIKAKYKRWNIYTGFSENSSGIHIGYPKPKKKITNLFENYILYTGYFRENEYVTRYLDFINDCSKLLKQSNVIVFIQREYYDNPELVFVKKIESHKIYKYRDIYVTYSIVSITKSRELFAYSEQFVGCQGNLSLASVINYKKFPLLEWRLNLAQSYCLLQDFLKKHNMQVLIPLIFNLTKKNNTKEFLKKYFEYKNVFDDFINLIHNKYNLAENLKKILL